ncbi:MAG: 8-oxo-dGTP diphosphatase [Polyangiaceae bacterium]
MIPRSLSEIDWASWTPVDRAVLLFVVRPPEILLIRKKRGLGAGKINAPGGRIDPGETPLQAAVREVREEVGVTPTGITEHGEIRFQFVDGYSIHVWVFRASDYEGELIETDEAKPHWFRVDEIPYHEMWQDDALWLPHVLNSKSLTAWFIFDGEAMLDQRIELAGD